MVRAWAESYYGDANRLTCIVETAGDCAIKVFKTSILVFKDRDKYVTGEFRFSRGYCKSNPRKMVRMWAEKEFRNLTRCVSLLMTLNIMTHSHTHIAAHVFRLKAAGINSPEPILLRSHVLVMSFIGSQGWCVGLACCKARVSSHHGC